MQLKKTIFSMAIATILSVNVANACQSYGYGVIGSYLFGTIQQSYTVSNSSVVMTRWTCIQQPNGTLKRDVYNEITYQRCDLASGNNMTVVASNQVILRTENFGYTLESTILATWTVYYNASLKMDMSSRITTPEESVGFDFRLFYNYSSSSSGENSYYCNGFAGS